MIKKIDKLIVKEFLLSLLLNFSIVIFILLMFALMQKFKYFIGKGLSIDIYAKFYFFYSLVSTPVALNISVLASSVMVFGSIGEHSELIAIKSAGISMLRTMRYPFIIALLLTLLGIFFNDKIHPYASLKAYSLLYDVRQKKPTLEFKEGIFYNDIPQYSIKIDKKYNDGQYIKGIMIYNHRSLRGNVQLITADSAYLQSTKDKQYIRLDLFDGKIYMNAKNTKKEFEFSRSTFDQARLFFTLASFKLKDTDEKLFMWHNIMKSRSELSKEMDSIKLKVFKEKKHLKRTISQYLSSEIDSLKSLEKGNYSLLLNDSLLLYKKDTININNLYRKENNNFILNTAMSLVRRSKIKINNSDSRINRMKREITFDQIDIYRKYADAIIIFIMFLIGAPLGAIIKRGGLGVPTLVAITCFTFYYGMITAGIKLAQEGIVDPKIGCWIAHMLCLSLACIFINEARKDSYLFDLDYYTVIINKFFRKKIF